MDITCAALRFTDAAGGELVPVREEDMKRLLQKANMLPLCPGVYVMHSKDGKVIYVGKSRKLRNRVSQYFQNSQKNIKTSMMVAAVHDFEHYVCDTEIEALTLENTLIKKYTPKYNIRLKDAKSYPYIKITDGQYPSLVMTRKRESDKGKYFGPYSGTSTVYSVIETLEKTLALPTCKHKFPQEIGKIRPCIYYQMGRCCGVCTGRVTPEEYAPLIRTAADILRGNISNAKRQLTEEMYKCSEEERYEAAAKCRDTIQALERLCQKQHVVASPDTDEDAIGLYSDEFGSQLSIFCIRDGAVSETADFALGREGIADEGGIISFLCEYYTVREYIPKTLLLSFELEDEDRELLSEFLSGHAQRRVEVRTPERGGNKTLCEMVRSNAEEKQRITRIRAERDESALLRLAELLSLETYPERIESYDISNIGSEHLTAGMVVMENGKFKKSDYRVFKIKTVEGTDDYASMREALSRRVAHLSDEDGSFSQYPDLILLDGGKAHVSVIRQLFDELNIEIPVFGMVKDDYHKTRSLCTDTDEISIAHENGIYMLLYKLQEEVHRFTVSKMSAAKTGTLKKSSLTNVKGIGASKAAALISALGGLGGVKNADVQTLAGVKGVSQTDARNIYEYFHKKSEDRQ